MTATPTPQPSPRGPYPPYGGPPGRPPDAKAKKPRRRGFLWIFLGVQLLFSIWIFIRVSAANDDDPSCEGLTGDALVPCLDAEPLGTTIGVGLIIGLWAILDIILVITYGIYRRRQRRQP